MTTTTEPTSADRPDFRARRFEDGWVVDIWTPRGWEQMLGLWETKREAVESTRPIRAGAQFCEAHWSWLCNEPHTVPGRGVDTEAGAA